MDWHIGCSGFSYKHWKEIFYPKNVAQSKWFEYYFTLFKTVELNVTFYRFPQLTFLQSWYRRSPDDFLFAVKAPRLITHFKKFNEAQDIITDFYEVISTGLAEKLGCVLFQMPPKFNYTEERFEKIIESLSSAFNNVLEFRHISWWNKTVFEKLAQNNITFCGMSHPQLPEDVIANTKVLYHRMHGVPQLYKSPYSDEELKKLFNKINRSKIVEQAYVYFNNDIDASAIFNAKKLLEYAA